MLINSEKAKIFSNLERFKKVFQTKYINKQYLKLVLEQHSNLQEYQIPSETNSEIQTPECQVRCSNTSQPFCGLTKQRLQSQKIVCDFFVFKVKEFDLISDYDADLMPKPYESDIQNWTSNLIIGWFIHSCQENFLNITDSSDNLFQKCESVANSKSLSPSKKALLQIDQFLIEGQHLNSK